MLIVYLIAWIAGVALAFAGCTIPALLLGIVLIGIYFRWELLKLARLFGPQLRTVPPARTDSSG